MVLTLSLKARHSKECEVIKALPPPTPKFKNDFVVVVVNERYFLDHSNLVRSGKVVWAKCAEQMSKHVSNTSLDDTLHTCAQDLYEADISEGK